LAEQEVEVSPYSYQAHRPHVFTEEGQRDLYRVLKAAVALSRQSGAVTGFVLMKGLTGLNWDHLALLDRLEEMGALKKVGTGHRPDDAVYVVDEGWVSR
jgi:hypothetical protein